MALHRSEENKVLMGVCQGFAEEYQMDVSIVRLIVVLISLFTAFLPALLAYIIIGAVLPVGNEKKVNESKEENNDDDFTF